jgi:hypothetical protein
LPTGGVLLCLESRIGYYPDLPLSHPLALRPIMDDYQIVITPFTVGKESVKQLSFFIKTDNE